MRFTIRNEALTNQTSPNYLTGVSISSGYTVTEKGFILFSAISKALIVLYINDIVLISFDAGGSQSLSAYLMLPVTSGDVVKVYSFDSSNPYSLKFFKTK